MDGGWTSSLVSEGRGILTWRPARADCVTCFLGSTLALPPLPPFALGSDMFQISWMVGMIGAGMGWRRKGERMDGSVESVDIEVVVVCRAKELWSSNFAAQVAIQISVSRVGPIRE